MKNIIRDSINDKSYYKKFISYIKYDGSSLISAFLCINELLYHM